MAAKASINILLDENMLDSEILVHVEPYLDFWIHHPQQDIKDGTPLDKFQTYCNLYYYRKEIGENTSLKRNEDIYLNNDRLQKDIKLVFIALIINKENLGNKNFSFADKCPYLKPLLFQQEINKTNILDLIQKNIFYREDAIESQSGELQIDFFTISEKIKELSYKNINSLYKIWIKSIS